MSIELTFGKNVKALRMQAGLSQEELALEMTMDQDMTIDQAYISRVETGHKNLGIQTIGRIAKALNTTPAKLLEGCSID